MIQAKCRRASRRTQYIRQQERLTTARDRNLTATYADAGHVDFVAWMVRLFTWDGVLPVCILLVPTMLQWLLPGRRVPVELAAIVLPIVAFLVRAVAGSRHIAANNCPPRFRQVQGAALALGIIVLLFIDCIAMLSHLIPQLKLQDYLMLYATCFTIYIVPMALVMYPGRTRPPPETLNL